MSDRTKIEWTEATWNPVTGCTKVSPGCDHCYAETLHERFHGKGSFATVQTHPTRLGLPLKWRRPRRVFVNSMSDLFHDDVSDEFIAEVFAVMAQTPRHTYQLLTKRHARMRSLLSRPDFAERVWNPINPYIRDVLYRQWPLRNVWLGVSVEDQKWADIRIPALLDTPAAVRWISAEPLLGPVQIPFFVEVGWCTCYGGNTVYGHEPGCGTEPGPAWGNLDWVVVGGESGPGARPMESAWARSLQAQCGAAGVPFFFKQAGEVLARLWGCTDRKGHNPDEWPGAFALRRDYPPERAP